MPSIKEQFLLEPDVHFLNHGSFGATPIPVFDAYQRWQRRLESQPVRFLGRDLDGLLKESRAALGEYLHADADDLVYIPNATHGANIVARSLNLQPGDEVLTTDHEYGACDFTWEFVCGKVGAKYVRAAITLPIRTEEEIVEEIWRGVTPRTKIIYLSHITSPTALRLPVEQICARARQRGILSVVDAAHSPGQIPVDLQALNADIVFGNCHKWMLSPKGAAFIYVRREIQSRIEPFVVSWGYHALPETTTGSRFIDLLQWTGTKDPAAALAVPDAIAFMRVHDWDSVRANCRALLRRSVEWVCGLAQTEPAYPLNLDFFSQMAIAPLPRVDVPSLKRLLYDDFKVEVPIIEWRDKCFVRISIQAYNTREDVDALLAGLRQLLPRVYLPHR
jgi:isopenicillin-N epimerase